MKINNIYGINILNVYPKYPEIIYVIKTKNIKVNRK